jgi:cytochrome c oxidase subunit 3
MTKHPFHLVNPSPWPLLSACSLLFLTISIVMYLHEYNHGFSFLISSFLLLASLAGFWWRDLIRESTYLQVHNHKTETGLKIGFLLFIISESMLFVSLFWCFLHSSLSPVIHIGSQWPPYMLNTIALYLPLVNTFLLLTSGASITYAHLALLNKRKIPAIQGLIITIILAIIFSGIQLYEYYNSPFSMSDSIYGSIFYMLTGIHGLHVIIGTIFIVTQMIRMIKRHYKANSIALEMSILYWHFVDVIWIIVFLLVYTYGNYTI